MTTPEELDRLEQISASLPKDFEGLVEKLSGPDASARFLATCRLMNLDDPRSVEPLIRALEDESAQVRAGAALALGHYQSAEAVPALLAHLKNDPSGHVRGICASSLGWIGGDEAMDALVPALKDRDWHVRVSAASVFARVKDRRAITELLGMLQDENAQARYAVCDALVTLQVGDERIVEAILKLRELPEIRDAAEMFAAGDVLMQVLDDHPEAEDLLEEFDESNPEATMRETLRWLRERLGEEAVRRVPDDPLLELAEKARKLIK